MGNPEFELKHAERVGEAGKKSKVNLAGRSVQSQAILMKVDLQILFRRQVIQQLRFAWLSYIVCKFSSLFVPGPDLLRVDTKRNINQLLITFEKLGP